MLQLSARDTSLNKFGYRFTKAVRREHDQYTIFYSCIYWKIFIVNDLKQSCYIDLMCAEPEVQNDLKLVEEIVTVKFN